MGTNQHKLAINRGLSRRQAIASLYLEGKSQPAIARALGISQPMVSKHLARLREEWRASTQRDYGEKVAEDLAKLAHLEELALESFVRSKMPLKNGLPERPGDSRFLAEAFKAREAKLKILGLLKGQSTVVTTNVINWDSLLTAAREERAAAPDPIAARLREIEAGLAASSPPQLPGPNGNGSNQE